MIQLRDCDLVERILAGEIVTSGFPEPYCNLANNDDIWYGKDSPVQPSSLDLHVGDIYLPNEKEVPRDSYSIKTGQTVIITTSEELDIPANYSAFGFPPDNLSSKGILMVNLGHLDPGWKGKIKFVLINFGKEDYPIKKNEVVGTFLVFKLDDPVDRDYVMRRPGSVFPSPPKVDGLIRVLSKDFLDVEKRSKKIVTRTSFKYTIINSFLGTIFVALITCIGYFFTQNNNKEINDIKIEVQSVKKDYDYAKLKIKVDSLERVMNRIGPKK